MKGQWEIQEEDKSYIATLDPEGNGTYTWKNGTIKTLEFTDGKWRGTWHQSGNDREGGFEVLLSEDGQKAEGVWWYTRVGENDNIPDRKFGGDYVWIRLPAHSGKSDEPGSSNESDSSDEPFDPFDPDFEKEQEEKQ